MNKKQLALILIIFTIIIVSSAAVSAGLFDFNNKDNNDLKTHEFNYVNKVSFNISDELTNNTEVKNIIFGEGVSYQYPANEKSEYAVIFIKGVGYGGSDEVELYKNDAYREEIEKNHTSQGNDVYIFKWKQAEMYDVCIDLKNMTIIEPNGMENQYHYFTGCFQTLEEAHIFMETFKINEELSKEGV